MKNFKLLLLLAAVMFGFMSASAINVNELQAQNEVKNYLTRQGFTVEIDDTDNSVMFRQQDILYWITFQGERGGNGVLYTLHRRPIKLRADKDDDDAANRKNEVAIIAANTLNRTMKYKTFVKDCRVDFVFPMYASTPQEYIKQLRDVLESMLNIKKEFTQAFDRSKSVADSIHKFWNQNDTARVILPQKQSAKELKTVNIKINKVSIGSANSNSVDSDRELIVPFDGILQSRNCQYIVERLSISAESTGECVIGVKIFNPQGKFLAPTKEAVYTVELPIEVKKGKKDMEIEMPGFGTTDSNFWKPGVYRMEIYENGRLLRKDVVFNISE